MEVPIVDVPIVDVTEGEGATTTSRGAEPGGSRGFASAPSSAGLQREVTMGTGDGIRAVVLKCPNCGANLSIPADVDTLACGYCGSQQIVWREGGTVSLRLLEQTVAAKRMNRLVRREIMTNEGAIVGRGAAMGKAWLASALSALANGRSLTIGGTGACDSFGIETISYIDAL